MPTRREWIVTLWPLLVLVALYLGDGSAIAQETAAGGPAVEGGLRILGHSAGEVAAEAADASKDGRWHNDDYLCWSGAGPREKLDIELPVKTGGRQHTDVVLTRGPQCGIVQFYLDGEKVAGEIDLYYVLVTPTVPIPLGICDLAKGEHKLTAEIVGANKRAKGKKHLFGIDRIILRAAAEVADRGAVDSTTAIEELYRLELLPRLRPGVRCKMFSSYDRTGGNDDGFSKSYSTLWIEDGNCVLAKMDGTGCIQRIWTSHSRHKKPGLLNGRKEHLKVYLDGESEPAVDVPLADLLSGTLERFPKPLAGEGQGGFYCYMPIPYRDGCKVVVEGTGVRFYQITYREFPNAGDVASFRSELSPRQMEALDAAVRAWSNLGDLAALGVEDTRQTAVDLALGQGESKTIDLPPGAHMVRAVYLEGEPDRLNNAIGARLQIRWDGAEAPAVDLPVEYFFCRALDPPPYRSLLVGNSEKGWYSFMPMPYRRAAALTITAEKPLQASLRMVTVPLARPRDDLGYLHAIYSQELPPQPKRHYLFLRRSGKGHYAGTYLVTEGLSDKKMPVWLEGDDRFTVEGQLAIHGTGSEDYFNCGWYAVEGRLDGPGSQPLHGFPVYRMVGERNQAVAYRWHVSDPVPYDSSIVAEMEHGGHNDQPADYRSAAFFYEAAP